METREITNIYSNYLDKVTNLWRSLWRSRQAKKTNGIIRYDKSPRFLEW